MIDSLIYGFVIFGLPVIAIAAGLVCLVWVGFVLFGFVRFV